MSHRDLCAHCSNPLPTNHQGPCPECGKSGKIIPVSISERLSVSDSTEGQESDAPQFEENLEDAITKPLDLSLQDEISGRVQASKDEFPASWEQFHPAWRAFPIRFSWCKMHDEEFTESFKRAGGGPGKLEREIQDREIFAFFVTGLSAVETYSYALYAIGSMISPACFPIHLKRDLRGINPEGTQERFKEAFKNDEISFGLRDLVRDPTFLEWKRIRNSLVHYCAPGRIINLSVGSSGSRDDLWNHLDFEIPINAKTTRRRRNWLADTLSSLQAKTNDCVKKYL